MMPTVLHHLTDFCFRVLLVHVISPHSIFILWANGNLIIRLLQVGCRVGQSLLRRLKLESVAFYNLSCAMNNLYTRYTVL